MLAKFRIAPLLVLALSLVATTALAFTEQELLARAVALDADYDDLQAAVQSAQPEDYPALVAQFEALEVERLQLKADRATLGGCSCTQLDAVIAAIDATASTIEDVIDGWQN